MSELVILMDAGERLVALERYKDDPDKLNRLEADYFLQYQLDSDIRGWSRPREDYVDRVINWLLERMPDRDITRYDYRQNARVLASQLLFAVQDTANPVNKIGRVRLQELWDEQQKADYWRCVGICSAVWEERK
jgi:hypothetical protein